MLYLSKAVEDEDWNEVSYAYVIWKVDEAFADIKDTDTRIAAKRHVMRKIRRHETVAVGNELITTEWPE